ncbi:hypothetical protein PGH07_00845 [Sulfurovum sp. zt1-1]|uniref:Cytochrome c domain-containing protein n=1 Tax=Sulfurovum zhangzhouensis TaxID=3019067 RepID=A0ABT7QVG7_9BACT|nr:hypothetical protein [Sulfurovum zhangzhouensis]MDM5270721.1 hypothetical protein [Sulfurovum zhangzhouensis]
MQFKRNRIMNLMIVLMGTQIGLNSIVAQPLDTQLVEQGKYLVKIGGCNDCHTPDYLLSGGKTPQKLWLTGSSFGWKGPWGTTYPPNLRLLVQGLTEKQWIERAKNLKTRPPMPWYVLNEMKEEDLRAIYHFIQDMGPGGEPAPQYLPPDIEPTTPYALFPSPPSKKEDNMTK